jgi:uncharacterized protein (TIGR02453 family)
MPNSKHRAVDPVFGPETFLFFRELARNNSKPWMDRNRDRYRDAVVAPMRGLLDRLTPAVLQLDPGFDVSGRTGRNFSRINRDIRFARDKSPYRPQMYLKFSVPNGPEDSDCQLYVGVAAEVVTAGLRLYHSGHRSLTAQRVLPRVAEHHAWLERQRRRLARRYESYWYASERGEWTKHVGWPVEPDEWKKLKGWVVRRKMVPAAACRPGFPVEIGRVFREVFPLYGFTALPDWRP